MYGISVDEHLLMLTPFVSQVTIGIIEIPRPEQQWIFIRVLE
jgi:hypothetical protein